MKTIIRHLLLWENGTSETWNIQPTRDKLPLPNKQILRLQKVTSSIIANTTAKEWVREKIKSWEVHNK